MLAYSSGMRDIPEARIFPPIVREITYRASIIHRGFDAFLEEPVTYFVSVSLWYEYTKGIVASDDAIAAVLENPAQELRIAAPDFQKRRQLTQLFLPDDPLEFRHAVVQPEREDIGFVLCNAKATPLKCRFRELGTAREEHASFASGDVLARVEAEASDIADETDVRAFEAVPRAEREGAVFDDEEIMFSGDSEN